MQTRAPFQGHPDPASICAKVIAYAKQRNSRELMRLLRDGYSLLEKSYGRDAIFYLCVSVDLLSVQYLIEQFNLPYKQSLVFGSAAGGHHNSVVFILNSYQSSPRALLKLNADLFRSVMHHFALGGVVDMVDGMLSKTSPEMKLNWIPVILNGYVLNGSCQDQIDYWMSDPVIEGLSREINRSPSSIRDDFNRVVLQARAELGMETEVHAWNSCFFAKGGHESAVLRYLDQSVADYMARYENNRMDVDEIRRLSQDIDSHGLVESVAAVWFSSELSLKIIRSNFSASDKVVAKVISNGNNKLASTWLIWLSKSFWIDEIHRATWVKRLRPESSIDNYWLKLDDLNLDHEDFVMNAHVECIERFFKGERSLDAVMSYEPDLSVDGDIFTQAMHASRYRFERLLVEQMQVAFENKNFSALNMLRHVWCLVLGPKIPMFEFSKQLTANKATWAASFINDSEFRDAMTRRFYGGNENIEVILKTSYLTNRFAREYLLEIRLAKSMLERDVLSAYHLIEAYQRTDEGLPFDKEVFSIIFTMLLGVNEQDGRAIYEAIMIHLFESQPPGMNLQHKLDVFGLFKPALPSGDHTPGNDRPFLRC